MWLCQTLSLTLKTFLANKTLTGPSEQESDSTVTKILQDINY